MNRPNPFASTSFFKPASSLLASSHSLPSNRHRRSLSLDDSDLEADRAGKTATMDDRVSRLTVRHSSQDRSLSPIPLIDISRSRSPSPYARTRSAAQSEDEDDVYEAADVAQSRPLVSKHARVTERNVSKRTIATGGVGQFLFGTEVGWRIYVALLVFWIGGCQFGLLLMNRFIFWTGTYKFPYPLTMTLIQLAITHVLILAFASLTRGLSRPLTKIGLGSIIAPSQAYSKSSRYTRYSGGLRHQSIWTNILQWLTHGSGGIAGGGLFEWQWDSAKQLLPVAGVFTAKVLLSNLSYAYTVLPMYMLARIPIIPLSLLLSALLSRQSYSISTLSASLVATANLLMASIRPSDRVTWESVVAGLFSSFFVSLYPILLLRAYRALVSDLLPSGDLLSSSSSSDSEEANTGSKEETRAYYRCLHYTSLLSLFFLLPLVLLSGEVRLIRRNCYFLDVPWFWFLMGCGGVGSFAVFTSTLLLVKATSPLTATFVSVPRSVFQLVVLSKGRMPAHAWVGAALAGLSCVWYLVAGVKEGRVRRRVGA